MNTLAILNRLGQGEFLSDLADAIKSVANEVATTQSPGSVTVRLTIKPTPDPVAVAISESITKGTPRSPGRGAFLFAHGGELHARDPRQPELPEMTVVIRGETIDRTTGEIIETDQPAPEVRNA